MAGVTGDFRRLDRILSGFRTMERPAFLNDAGEKVGKRAHQLVMDSFNTETDPYGLRWPPSKRAIRTGTKTLVDTGKLRASIAAEPRHNGFRIYTNVKYAAIHNFGGSIGGHQMPRRMFIPPPDRMGTRWERALTEEAKKYLKKTVGRP